MQSLWRAMGGWQDGMATSKKLLDLMLSAQGCIAHSPQPPTLWPSPHGITTCSSRSHAALPYQEALIIRQAGRGCVTPAQSVLCKRYCVSDTHRTSTSGFFRQKRLHTERV